MNWLAKGCVPKVQLTFFLAKAFKSTNGDLCHFAWVPFPQRLQILIMLPPQSWKHPQVSMKLPFNFFLPHSFPPVVLHQNTHTGWKYIMLMENWSVIVSNILQMIRTVTSSTFLELCYRLGCCLISDSQTAANSISLEIFSYFAISKSCILVIHFRDKWPAINYSLIYYFLLYFMFH